jgi:hypothetical protein
MKTAAGTVRWEHVAGPLRYGAQCNPGAVRLRQAVRQMIARIPGRNSGSIPCVPENEKSQAAQVEKIAEIVKRNANAQVAKCNYVKKAKPRLYLAEKKVPPQKHPDDVIFAEMKSETSPNFRRTWAEAPTKVCRRFLREGLNW